MAWFWVIAIVLLVLLWVVSLCKVLYAPWAHSEVAFLLETAGEIIRKRNVLLVVAHPDDESMFFSPTVLFLIATGHNLHILCISTGNADGRGFIRREEFFRACAALKVKLQQVKILDFPSLQDGFDKKWSHSFLAKIIGEEITNQTIDSIITFDNYGVSGHPNHCDVHEGLSTFLKENSLRSIEAWELVSTSIVRKYCGPVDIWLSMLHPVCYKKGEMHCLLNRNPRTSFLAMAQHESQWVWFRKLFVLFSSYTYVNSLRRIKS